MKRFLLVISAFLILNSAFAQNLVINPDFELSTSVTCSWTGSGADFTNGATNWTSPTGATPDNFSTLITPNCTSYQPHSTDPSCNGYQAPHSGNYFAGFYTYVGGNTWREYIQAQLSSPMIIGQSYIVSMYISLADNSQYATNNIGIGFSTAITNLGITGELGYTPEINHALLMSDTTNWVLFSDTITATAAWQYLIIGNFYTDAGSIINNFNPGGVWDRTYYYVDDVSVESNVAIPPVINFTASERFICPGTCISFTNFTTNATSYQWIFDGGNPGTSTDVNPNPVCYDTTGVYNVTLIASNSSFSDTVTLNNLINVYTQPIVPSITQSGDSLFAPAVYATYQWYFGSDTISGATNYFHVATQSGNYNLVVTDDNGCTVGAGIVNVVANLTPTLSNGEGVGMFPNPSNGNFEITFVSAKKSLMMIEMFNGIGQKVYSQEKIIAKGENKIEVSNQNLFSGIYLLKIFDNEIFITKKVMIQK